MGGIVALALVALLVALVLRRRRQRARRDQVRSYFPWMQGLEPLGSLTIAFRARCYALLWS